MKKTLKYCCAALIGFINAIFGAGGGMIAVPYLKKLGLEQKQAQATAIAVILPLTIISSIIYFYKGYYSFSEALPFLPFGLVGAIFGTKLLPKMGNKVLKTIFSLFMIWAGIRMITR